MPSELSGGFFKPVVSALLTAEVLFPELKKRADAMDFNEWYSWDEDVRWREASQAKG